MNKKTYDCPGCGRKVEQFKVKNHVTKCDKYLNNSFFYSRAIKCSDSDKINQIKFMAEELSAAKDHLELILSKKGDPVVIDEQDDFSMSMSVSNNFLVVDHKHYKSQVYEEPQKPHIKKHHQSYHEPQYIPQPIQSNPKSDDAIQMELEGKFGDNNKMQQEPKQQIAIMAEEPKGAMKDYERQNDHRVMNDKPNGGMKDYERQNDHRVMNDKPNGGMKDYERQNDYNYEVYGGYGNNKKGGMKNEEYEQDIDENNPDIVKCPLCKQKFWSNYNVEKLEMMEECWRMVCKKCFKKYIEDNFVQSNGFPKCPYKDCTYTIPEYQSKAYLGDKYGLMQDKVFKKMNNFNLVECSKCQSQYDFAPGNPNDAPKNDNNGKPVRHQYAILYAEQRFICTRPDCKTQQCKQCQVSPYHLGMSCKEFKERALMLKCRYCDTPITDKNLMKNAPKALQDICNSSECQQYAKDACAKISACSHPCSGVKNEAKCLPCLKEGCCQKEASLVGQSGNDYCSICFSEGLNASPAIQCGCSHIFHFRCIKKRFQIKWLTPRILFNFCVCPLCKKWIEVPPENQLYNKIKQMRQLYELIQKMSLERLKFEECEKDEKLVSKESEYFNKPMQYAMAIYAYFMCFKCKKPYFGGRKNCAQVMNADQNREKQGFDEKELVCPKCCDIPIENCPKHGVDFIEFKCKFCCSTAQWFCWGNTHFCEPCHKKQCTGDYVSKYTKDQLPKCKGPGECPIGGNHGLNGEEKMLGCAICRNYKDNSKNF